MPRDRRPSQRSLRETLMQSVFDPRAPGPMSIIVGLDNPQYGEIKAIELIREAQAHPTDYHEKVTQAISLLALARLQRDAHAEKTVQGEGGAGG